MKSHPCWKLAISILWWGSCDMVKRSRTATKWTLNGLRYYTGLHFFTHSKNTFPRTVMCSSCCSGIWAEWSPERDRGSRSVMWFRHPQHRLDSTCFSCGIQVWLYRFLSIEITNQRATWLVSTQVPFTNKSFFSSSVTHNLELAPTRLTWPHSGNVASEYQQVGHLGGLVWIKSYFSVSPPAPPRQGRGLGSRQAAPELITQSSCRQDHTPWKDKGCGTERSWLLHEQRRVCILRPESALQEFSTGWGGEGWRGRVELPDLWPEAEAAAALPLFLSQLHYSRHF